MTGSRERRGEMPKAWTCPDCGRLNEYYPYPTRCSRCGYLHTPEAVPEGLVDVSQLKALDLPNVRLAGSYATGRPTPKSDVDILVGLTDDEWSRVAPHEPPEAVNRLFSILPEDSLDVKLYKLSDVKDMWYFKRGRRGVSGVFVPVDDAEMVQGLWNSSIGLKEIPAGELLECMICHEKFDHLILGTCESCYKKWTGGR